MSLPGNPVAFLEETLDVLCPDTAAYQRLLDAFQHWHDYEEIVSQEATRSALFDSATRSTALWQCGKVDALGQIIKIMKARQAKRK